MGLYQRNKRGRDGKLRQSFIWWMCYASDGKRHCESTKTTNKRLATRILNKRLSEIVEGKFSLPKSNAPKLEKVCGRFPSIHQA